GVVVLLADIADILPELGVVQLLVALGELERVDDIVRRERLAVLPVGLAVEADEEGGVVRVRDVLGQDALHVARYHVEAEQRLVPHHLAIPRLRGPGRVRAEGVEVGGGAPLEPGNEQRVAGAGLAARLRYAAGRGGAAGAASFEQRPAEGEPGADERGIAQEFSPRSPRIDAHVVISPPTGCSASGGVRSRN